MHLPIWAILLCFLQFAGLRIWGKRSMKKGIRKTRICVISNTKTKVNFNGHSLVTIITIKNRIDIVKMMPSSHIVKESKEKRKKIILTENDLKAMVKECVRRIMRR